MPGGGTKLADTPHNPPARLLDLTRLISRAGRVHTGVDRVEHAYLRHLSGGEVPLYGLVRTTLGYVLLDAVGLAAVGARLSGQVPWGSADLLSRLARSKPDMVRRAESDLRRVALARCRPRNLGRMLGRHLPGGTEYFNTGHSNLTDRVFSTLRHVVSARIVVMIHDTIPLDFPDLQRPGTPALFRGRLMRVRAHADLVLYNSVDTRNRAERHMSEWGAVPKGAVAPLGVPVPTPDLTPRVADLIAQGPFFVTVGTIEPRKNHALLLDTWATLGPGAPRLLICGARGWNNAEVFARLDRAPDGIVECPGFSDGEIAALLQASRALLFPSIAEGYGLPPLEAAALGTPVVCADLPVYRETLGNIPVYLKESEPYQWAKTVESLMTGRNIEHVEFRPEGFVPPGWQAHFNTVLSGR